MGSGPRTRCSPRHVMPLSPTCPPAPRQDPRVPDAAPAAHGLAQQPHQHARPQPGHRLGPQPAAVSAGEGTAGTAPPPAPKRVPARSYRRRSRDIEATGFNGTAAFMEVRVQSIVVEFILTHVEQLFGDAPLRSTAWGHRGGTHTLVERPYPDPRHSVSVPAGAESPRRSLLLLGAAGGTPAGEGQPPPFHVPAALSQGDGPPPIRPYHTIIELGEHRYVPPPPPPPHVCMLILLLTVGSFS